MNSKGLRRRLTAVLTAGLMAVSAVFFPGRAAACLLYTSDAADEL